MADSQGGSARVSFKIDTIPVRTLSIVAGATVAFLVVMFIVGLSGPNAHESWEVKSFTCGDNTTTDDSDLPDFKFDPDVCSGTPMTEKGYVQQVFLPPPQEVEWSGGLSSLNYQFSLVAWPYNNKYGQHQGTLRDSLQTRVSLLGTDDYEKRGSGGDDGWYYVVANRTSRQTLLCPKQHPDCYGFVLILERRMDYKYYRMDVEFLNNTEVDNVLWETKTETPAFNRVRIGFRSTYLAISILLLVFWVWVLFHQPRRYWAFEQQSVLILLVALVFFNNPFFALEFVSESWVLAFLDNFFAVTFLCLLLMFWFFILDDFRSPLRKEGSWMFRIKYGVILVFGVLALSLFSWMDIRFNVQPVLGADNLDGIVALYYITSCFLGAIIIWLIVLALLTLPTIYAKPYLEFRYMYLAVPACLICLSFLIGIFAGTFGPYNRSLLSFVYFFALLNSYVYLLVFGFYPSEDWFARVQFEDFGSAGMEYAPISVGGNSRSPQLTASTAANLLANH